MFAAHRIDEQLAKAMDRKVWLPSGGTLVIDRTEAMTVVDVNTGKFTGPGGNLEQTVTRNNLEAAEEIVRQLRLRDIGGIIVIDFIDMVLESNRDLVLRRLAECLGRDRTRHQVAEVTSLGLVQMTRKRVGTGLLEAFSTPCEHCGGRGRRRVREPVGIDRQPRTSPTTAGAAVGGAPPKPVQAGAAAAAEGPTPPPPRVRRAGLPRAGRGRVRTRITCRPSRADRPTRDGAGAGAVSRVQASAPREAVEDPGTRRGRRAGEATITTAIRTRRHDAEPRCCDGRRSCARRRGATTDGDDDVARMTRTADDDGGRGQPPRSEAPGDASPARRRARQASRPVGRPDAATTSAASAHGSPRADRGDPGRVDAV